MAAAAFRELLEAGDVDGLRRIWSEIAPGLPQPETREQAEIAMHIARTASDTMKIAPRVYSHRWLTERMLPSMLPDDLRAVAEREEKRIVEAVGVSVNFRSPVLAPAAAEVQREVNVAIEDCYANGDTQVELVRARMDEARDRTMRALFG